MRVCAVETCDTKLSRYNDESICATCTRAGLEPKRKPRITKKETPHLRTHRLQQNWWGYEGLARAAGVTTATIARAERGEAISLTSIEKIAKPLNLRRSDLTGRGKG